jgi:hypothetical protein
LYLQNQYRFQLLLDWDETDLNRLRNDASLNIALDLSGYLRGNLKKIRRSLPACSFFALNGKGIPQLATKHMENEMALAAIFKKSISNAAKILGIYPRKGALTIGADADLIAIPKKYRLTDNDKNGYGNTEYIKPAFVIKSGRILVENESVAFRNGSGMFLQAKRGYTYFAGLS